MRVIPSDRASCPAVTADGLGVTLTVAVAAAAGFDRILCDASLPQTTQFVRVGTRALPRLPRRIARFVVLGDTGCRITGTAIQNCRDGQAWPFARIAQSIASAVPRPDLIVHTGDYQSREAPCPAGDPRCAGSPFGDEWGAWAIDFFEPGAPLFATAPLLWVRGDDEACARAGSGWSRYLAPAPEATCRVHDDPAIATFDDLRLVNLDSAAGDETPAESGAADRETLVLTHRPPPADLAARAAGDPDGTHLAAIIAGQLPLFAVVPARGGPPVVIVGTGGETLASAAASDLNTTSGTIAEARFGYAVFDRIPGGWSISERDPDGAEHRRCVLRAREVHC